MHEFGIARAVLEAVRVETETHPGTRVRKVGLRLGELAGVNGEALRFCFEALIAGTPLAEATLEIEPRPRRHRCPACRESFVVVDYRTACPRCGRTVTDCIEGDELELAYLELEET